jgi:LTXXQ motif family protein
MKRNSRLLTVAMISAVGLGAGSALAQQAQQQMPMMGYGMGQMGMGQTGMMGPGNMGMMGPGMHGMMGPGMMMDVGPMMEGRLAYTKAELGITDAQTAAWDGYVTAVKARASNMHTAMMQAMQAGTALERLDARTKAMESMVDSLKALRPATEKLYGALSDDQKKKADLLLGMGCCMM